MTSWLIASALLSSGATYVVFGFFLSHRRYWAWLAMTIMTVIMLAFVGCVCGFLMIRSFFWDWGSVVALVCWWTALGLILHSLRQALPAVREAEAVVQKGFSVIPVAGLAPVDEVKDAARERAG